MISSLLHDVLRLHGPVLYAIIGALVFAEDAFLVGVIAPGETAAIVAGVAASQHHATVVVACLVVVVAAILGDSVGYQIGRRFGSHLATSRLLRRRAARIEAAERLLRRHGGAAVFLGRFIAFVRTVIPFLAGSTRMRYGTFVGYNIAGGAIWGTGCVIAGYLAGDSYQTLEKVFGRTTIAILILLVVAALVVWRVRARRRGRRRAASPAGDNDAESNDAESTDAESTDAESTDAESTDAGTDDAGNTGDTEPLAPDRRR